MSNIEVAPNAGTPHQNTDIIEGIDDKEKTPSHRDNREALKQAQDFIEKQYGINLMNPPSLHDLMRVDQFAYLVPENLTQRKALQKIPVVFVQDLSGMGAGGFTPKDGSSLQLFFHPYFGDIEDYAERIPMTTGFHSPSVFMHEATHLSEYIGTFPEEVITKVKDIISAANQRGTDAFMTRYSASEYSELSDDAGEVLTTITERYIDNPVKFARDMDHPDNADEREIATLLIKNNMLPQDALDVEIARKKLHASNRHFIHPNTIAAIGKDVEALVKKDVENLTDFLGSPYLGMQLLEKEHAAEFNEINKQLSILDTELKKEDLDIVEETDLIKKRDTVREKSFVLRNRLMRQALDNPIDLKSLLNNQPIAENYSNLMVFFFQNGFRPNISRSLRSVIELREKDILAMNPLTLSAHFRNPDVVEFMTILRDAAGVEFALQDVVEVANVTKEHPEILSKLRMIEVQDNLFDLQCTARFRNSDNNVRNLTQFVLTGKLMKEVKSYEPYEYSEK